MLYVITNQMFQICSICNAFKCNLKELTTKSIRVASGQGLVGRRMHSSRYNVFVAFCHASVRSGVVCSVCFGIPPPPNPPLLFLFCFVLFFSLFSTDLSVWQVPAFKISRHVGSWLGCGVMPAMGVLFNRGAGYQKWKPLDIPGTQLPLSDAVLTTVYYKKLTNY